MGLEQEIKLGIPDPATLDIIQSSPILAQYPHTPWETICMQTIYWDTADGFLNHRKWALRCRMENSTQMITLKTPQDADHTRGEWNLDADGYLQAGAILPHTFSQLYAQGAPREILDLAIKPLLAVCGVSFIRQRCLLQLPSDTQAELALDHGVLTKHTWQQPFAELELECKSGPFAPIQALAQRLEQIFHLSEEPLSKFARANALHSVN